MHAQTLLLSNSLELVKRPKELPAGPYPFPYEYDPEKGIDPPEYWQRVDLDSLYNRTIVDGNSANWSEMGAKKTSTGLWLIQRLMEQQGIENPSVLVVTTRTGKGTFFKLAPDILKGWTIFNVDTNGLSIIDTDGKERRIPKGSIDRIPEKFGMPTLVVTHFHIFSKTNQGQFEIDKATGLPKKNEHGGLIMKPGTMADSIARHEWDFHWIDETHRIKDKDTAWTVVLKRVKSRWRHVSTGTGFINRPDEIWSPLNFLDKRKWSAYWKFKELFCNTPDAPIWMADLSFKSLGEIEVGDKVVGWRSEESGGRWGETSERKLVEAEVLAVKRRTAPIIVKVTMKSGRILKCTPDHLWLSGRGHGDTDRFVDVLGSRQGVNMAPKLVRVVDPTPTLVEPQKLYAAAYLGGIMDGEGTWPIIAQSREHNPQVHARIVECLNELQIPWVHPTDIDKFRLNGSGNGRESSPGRGLERNLAARQRATDFLNWCKPAKRARIVASVLGKGRFRLGEEIEKVELIGSGEVVSMQTSTGNYIAWGYASKNCEIDDWDGYAKVVGVKPEMKEDFRRIVREHGPRRTLDEVMPHIKSPIYVEHDVDLNPVQRAMYDNIKNELYALDQKGIPLYASNVLSLLQRLRAICVATPQVIEDYYDPVEDRRIQKIKLVEPSSKLDAIMEILDGMEWDEDRRSPVVVFSNFVGPLMLLEKRLNTANRNAMEMGFQPEYPYLWLKASDDDQMRYHKWAELFPTLEYKIFMSTLQVGGESISLTAARHVIFLDRSWSPKDNNQGVGRIRRPGQEGQPIVININARDTTDQRIHAVTRQKEGWFEEIFGAVDDEGNAPGPKPKSKRAENDALLKQLFGDK